LMLRASQRSLRASPVCLRAPSFLSLLLLLFSATSPTEFYTLSLHDALPIYHARGERAALGLLAFGVGALQLRHLLALGAVELAGEEAVRAHPRGLLEQGVEALRLLAVLHVRLDVIEIRAASELEVACDRAQERRGRPIG